METQNLKDLYKKAFTEIDKGKSYEEISNWTGIPVELLRHEHIRNSRESLDYDHQIKFYTLKLIRKHGSQILSVDNINKFTQNIPYKFRSSVKHLIHNLKKQITQRKLDALS